MNDPAPFGRKEYRIRLMISPVRHFFYIRIAAILVAAASVFVLFYSFEWLESNPVDTDFQAGDSIAFVKSPPDAFNAVKDVISHVADAGKKGELSRRFRLAGTILGVANSGADEPMAVIDDRVQVVQKIVRRNESVVPGVTLTHVKSLSVVLRGPAGDEEIFLDKGVTPQHHVQMTSATGILEESAVNRSGTFKGGEVFPGRWEFERGVLLDYYSELRDEPERLLAVFDSLEPLYEDEDGFITGYQLKVKGEADFFAAAGLIEGDKVRSVNSLPMTNRRRAEALIAAFVEGNASTFIMEIERDGKVSKQVYVIE